jgi:hypothetical protein
VNHFSLLDHLRHLLVQAPELAVLGLPGGLSIWLNRNVEEISKWAHSARERWTTTWITSCFIWPQFLHDMVSFLHAKTYTYVDEQ